MALNIALLLLGLILAAMVLKDVFDTVVVPGGSRTSLRVAHRLVVISLPAWKRIRGRRRGLSSAFAPFILVSSFIIWMVLLALAFGLMAYSLGSQFQPPIRSFPQAIYMVGSSIVTIGLGNENALGFSRWIVLAAGFCGLAVMTMAVTYLLEVQGSIARRDTGIIKLNTSAGHPPSALTLLERFAAIRNRDSLLEVLKDSRTWCATVRQSHSSHPSLIYFQSVGTGAGWPAALGALLDLALILELVVDDERLYGPAILLADDGWRMARELAQVIGLRPAEMVSDQAEMQRLALRLAKSGYPLRASIDYQTMASRRADLQSCVNCLAEHLGKPTAELIRRQ